LDGGVSEGKAGGNLQKSARMTFVDNMTDIFNEMQSLEGSILVAVPSRREHKVENADDQEDMEPEFIATNTNAIIDTNIVTDGNWIRK